MENTKTAQTPTHNITNDGITRIPLKTDQNNPVVKEYVAAMEKSVKDLPPKDLEDALMWIWDAFERSAMPFFLIHQTYEDAKNDRPLTGDHVEIGVRYNEWTSGPRRILNAFTLPIEENDMVAEYRFGGVDNNKSIPVIVRIYPDHECIIATDQIRYRYEEFQIPNPYSKFKELYD